MVALLAAYLAKVLVVLMEKSISASLDEMMVALLVVKMGKKKVVLMDLQLFAMMVRKLAAKKDYRVD